MYSNQNHYPCIWRCLWVMVRVLEETSWCQVSWSSSEMGRPVAAAAWICGTKDCFVSSAEWRWELESPRLIVLLRMDLNLKLWINSRIFYWIVLDCIWAAVIEIPGSKILDMVRCERYVCYFIIRKSHTSIMHSNLKFSHEFGMKFAKHQTI